MPADPPPPPPGLPAYVRDGLEARSPDELRAVASWAEALAEHEERGLERELERPPDEDGDVAATHRYGADEIEAAVGADGPGEGEEDLEVADATGAVYLYWIETYCNKDGCSTCPHGPYPYIKYRVGDTVRTRYGKAVAAALDVDPPA